MFTDIPGTFNWQLLRFLFWVSSRYFTPFFSLLIHSLIILELVTLQFTPYCHAFFLSVPPLPPSGTPANRSSVDFFFEGEWWNACVVNVIVEGKHSLV